MLELAWRVYIIELWSWLLFDMFVGDGEQICEDGGWRGRRVFMWNNMWHMLDDNIIRQRQY